MMLEENRIAREIVDGAFKVHTTLGPGLLESVYERALTHELTQRGLSVACQVPIPVAYDDVMLEVGFRADMVVNDTVIVELKSVEKLDRVHYKQTLTYVRIAGKRLGLLINFGSEYIKDGIHRIANRLPDDG